jgi:hypothetical protein
MKPDWHQLIQNHLAGLASEEESAELETALNEDAKLRALYLDYANLDMSLEASAQAATALQEAQALPSPARKRDLNPVWLSLRPLTAAAVGILLGVLTTSAVWAYAVPKIPKMSRIPVPLVDPGFEKTTTPVPTVIPRTLNRWNGDASHVVASGDSAVKPEQGHSMLKMQPVEERRYSRIEQIVDVSHLVPDEDAAVEFSASFFCDGAVNQSRMLLVLRAFTMGADEISGTTEKLDEQVSSGARKGVLIPAGSSDWHEGRLRMDLPANTKTIVFSIAAVDLPEASTGSSRYIDDLKATIVTAHPAQR